MTTIKRYRELLDTHVNCYDHKCFFAFSNEQAKESMKRANINTDEKIYSYGYGLHGTKEGLKSYFAEENNILELIAKECNPQDVYDYEYNNHECGYIWDDKEAIEIVIAYFGKERALQVKRRCAHYQLDN